MGLMLPQQFWVTVLFCFIYESVIYICLYNLWFKFASHCATKTARGNNYIKVKL